MILVFLYEVLRWWRAVIGFGYYMLVNDEEEVFHLGREDSDALF